MPRMLPMAAPISRFRLTMRSFHSKTTIAAPINAPNTRIHIAGQSEGLNDEAGNRYNDEKKKTYKNEIHGKPPRGCSLPVCPYH